jgi:hypothetical protein
MPNHDSENPTHSLNANAAILAAMTPDIYQRFLSAVAIGKWPNAQALTAEQKATCIEAIIVYENQHVAPHLRTGYVPPKTEPCSDDSHIHTHEIPLKWK